VLAAAYTLLAAAAIIILLHSLTALLRIRAGTAIQCVVRCSHPLMAFYLFCIPFYQTKPFFIPPVETTYSIAGAFAIIYCMRFTLPLFFSRNSRQRFFQQFTSEPATGLSWLNEGARFVFRGLTTTTSITLWRISFAIYPLTLLILIPQMLITLQFSRSSADSFAGFALLTLSTAATILVSVDCIQQIPSRPLRLVSSAVFLGIYSLLALIHGIQTFPVDISLLLLNLDLVAYKESIDVIASHFSLWVPGFLAAAAALAVFLQKKIRLFTPEVAPRYGAGRIAIQWAAWLSLCAMPRHNNDEFSLLFRSILAYSSQKHSLASAAQSSAAGYPYMSSSVEDGFHERAKPPNIILVTIESFNGLMINRKTPAGREITPNFNAKIRDGLFIQQYYGNSIQTSRGFVSLLTGILPSYRKKIFTDHSDLSIRSIARILNEQGYTTIFFKAFHDLSFDNTGPFMKHLGFTHVRAIDNERLSEDDRKQVWGWGLQDDRYYAHVFTFIDSLHGRSSQPFFLTLLTVSNHMMFNHLPQDRKFLYPEARKNDFQQNLVNSIHLTDRYLRRFFSELEKRDYCRNTIVIITGDHGFPMGEFTTRNDDGFHEENFRTPFLMLWPGHIAPRTIRDTAYTHIDLCPTLLDILDISTTHNFIGKSIFAPGPRKPALLCQPYNGLYLCAVAYPYKFARSLTSGHEYLSDLSAPDGERMNIISRSDAISITSKLRDALNGFYINQTLIEEDRIWKKD
jgi:arylsulfatase A-like enzyme